MTYPDPFDDRSPWDETPTSNAPDSPETPVTTPAVTTAPNPFKIGLTFKASSGYDAEWITPTIYGATAEEVASRTVELVHALREHGVIELTSKAAQYTREQFKGGSAGGGSAPKRFENGRVVNKGQASSDGPADDDCQHGRKLVEKANWAALFCQARDKSDQCEPLWRQKDGSFKAK
ncbi:hypothetical protein AB0F36_07725 [Streptomyces sp. NPDC029080]|uniref:hypothetical protein n=1 Tax=Streptomyces sp. NPDC029080 TaxID=3155017 RepID=UPI0033DF55E0